VTSAEAGTCADKYDYTHTRRHVLICERGRIRGDDRIRGFQYQVSQRGASGLQVLTRDTTTKLAAQLGVGYRVLRMKRGQIRTAPAP